MTQPWTWAVCGLVVAAAAACADTENDRVSVRLFVAGTPLNTVETTRGVQVTLDVADLAFGPLYLCASTEAGEACDAARGEWLESTVVDALRGPDEPAFVGDLRATSGTYRSLMYDLGISSLLTRDEPLVLPAAEALDGASIHLAGDAVVDDRVVRFSLRMPIARTGDTELGVPIVRVRVPESERHTITTADDDALVTFDPRPWIAGIDFATLCAQGCDELDADGQAGRAVRNALTAGTPPTLQWNQQP